MRFLKIADLDISSWMDSNFTLDALAPASIVPFCHIEAIINSFVS